MCRKVSKAIDEFSEFINKHLLVDHALTWVRFTWARGKDSASRSTLNRFLLFPANVSCT